MDSQPTVVAMAELIDMLGVSKTRVVQLIASPGFPEPIAVLKAGKIWSYTDVTTWPSTAGARSYQSLPGDGLLTCASPSPGVDSAGRSLTSPASEVGSRSDCRLARQPRGRNVRGLAAARVRARGVQVGGPVGDELARLRTG